MAEKVVSPDVCVFSDENFETMNIQIELPGVDKDNIDLHFYEDGFYVVARGENAKYMSSYSLIFPVEPDGAIANYANGLLTVNVPYKMPFLPGVKLKVD